MRRMITDKQQELVKKIVEQIEIDPITVNVSGTGYLQLNSIAEDPYAQIVVSEDPAIELKIYNEDEGELKAVATFDEDGLLIGSEASYGINIYGDDTIKYVNFATSEDLNRFEIGYDGTAYGIWLGDNPVEYGMSIDPEGHIILNGLPTSNPQVVGALWNDNGTLKISAGE